MRLLENVDRLIVVDGYNPITFHNLQKLGLPMSSSSTLDHLPPPISIECSQQDDFSFLQESLSIQWLGQSL